MSAQKERVLLAWEQGLNLGHLLRAKAIVEALLQQQREVILAVSPAIAVRYAGDLDTFACTKVVVRQPHHNEGWCASTKCASFAGVLASQGWSDAEWLQRSLKAWINLFSMAKPVAIVLDYAPIAALAALVLKIPAVHVSSGFDAPPPKQLGIGRFRSKTGDVSAAELAEVATIDACVEQAVIFCKPSVSPPSLHEILSYPKRILDCLPQTDPYGARERSLYAPFLLAHGDAEPVVWPAVQSDQIAPRVFVYVRDHSVAPQLLSALSRLGVSTICFWPEYEQNMFPLPVGCVEISTTPLNLNSVLQKATLVVGYGSVGMSTHAVLAGVPQLILPTDLEKLMVAQRIHWQQLGICLEPGWGAVDLEQALHQLLHNDMYRQKCKAAMLKTEIKIESSCFLSRVISMIYRAPENAKTSLTA